jgi:hypothetical protein
MRTDAEPNYQKFLFLQLMGHAIGKNSICVINPEAEYHNLYILIVGDSFYGRKGVSQDMILSLYPQECILPNEFSPEQFIKMMSTKPNGILSLGEFSKILKACASGKSYLSTIIEVWNDLYRYKRETYVRETKSGGTDTIKNPYLCINATCTEEVLKKYIDTEMIDGGFFGRFIIVPGKARLEPRHTLPAVTAEIEKVFLELYDVLRMEYSNHHFLLDESAFARLNEIEKELFGETQVTAVAGRYGQAMIAIADLLALDEHLSSIYINNINYEENLSNLSKFSNISNISKLSISNVLHAFRTKRDIRGEITNVTKFTIIVSAAHIQAAYELIKPSIAFVKSLREYCESDRVIAKIKDIITKNKKINRSTLMQSIRLTKEKIDPAIIALEEAGDIITVEVALHEHKKPSLVYCYRKTVTPADCSVCRIRKYCGCVKLD